METAFGYNPEHRAKTVLSGLGFPAQRFAEPLGSFSGGWRERAKLAGALTSGADVLLLDEPTNHLDLEAVHWLEGYLSNFAGAVLFVAHDRVFMDNVGTHVLFFGGGQSEFWAGSFSDFLVWRGQSQKTKENMAAQLSMQIERQMAFVERFKAKATKASQARSRLKSVARLSNELNEINSGIAAGKSGPKLSFCLPAPKRGDLVVYTAEDLNFAHDGTSFLWSPLSFSILRGQKIALVGANGAGKTTLLRLIKGDLAPTAGYSRLGPRTKIGYFSQHRLEDLQPDLTVVQEMRRLAGAELNNESIFSVLGLFLLGEDYFDRQVRELSGGEKSRLALAGLFVTGAGFLVLDEPTNHLDLESREALIRALDEFAGTVLLVAHDRHILSQVAGEVWEIGQYGLEFFAGGFADYERAKALAETSGVPEPLKPSGGGSREKDARRLRAQLREEERRKLEPLRKEYAETEKNWEAALTRLEEIDVLLSEPDTFEDSDLSARLCRERALLGEQVEFLFSQLEHLEVSIAEASFSDV